MRSSHRLMTLFLASWDWLSIEGETLEPHGIETNPNVCGGEPCLVGTRIPVWVLEQARRLGSTESNLLQAYPMLRSKHLASAWSYVDSHSEEIEQQIRENEAA